MEHSFANFIFSWGPLIFIAIIWIFYIVRMKNNPPQKELNEIMKEQIVLIKQQNELFEKLVLNTEKIANSIGEFKE